MAWVDVGFNHLSYIEDSLYGSMYTLTGEKRELLPTKQYFGIL